MLTEEERAKKLLVIKTKLEGTKLAKSILRRKLRAAVQV